MHLCTYIVCMCINTHIWHNQIFMKMKANICTVDLCLYIDKIIYIENTHTHSKLIKVVIAIN